MKKAITLPAPVVEWHEGFQVVRDDLLPGGSKMRYILPYMEKTGAAEYVYASPAQGYAQIALAECARMLGVKATIFVAQRKQPHERTLRAMAAGANIVPVPQGYLNVVQARAREYCLRTGAALVPFGVNDGFAIYAFVTALQNTMQVRPSEVWVSAGSGTLCRALQMFWPDAKFNAVQVGKTPSVGKATLWCAPEKYEQPARFPPPFPSCSNYDAKVWNYIKMHAKPGALFWNVGA